MLAEHPNHLAAVLPVLVHIQTNLDGDLSTAALAARAGLSPAYFHRVFQRVTGETVKQYTLRLRLERAAYRLLVEHTAVVDIAADCGFRAHETFTRAFRRRFGVPPALYRSRRPPRADGHVERRPGAEERLDGFQLSQTRPRPMRPTGVIFIRHVGPYEAVDPDAWPALQRWAEARGVAHDGRPIGLAHDAPGLTPPELLRFDACLAVPEPVRPSGRVGYQVLAGGPYAVSTFIGPFRCLREAYLRIFDRATALAGYRMIGTPAVEVYERSAIGDADALNQTEIRLPLRAARDAPGSAPSWR